MAGLKSLIVGGAMMLAAAGVAVAEEAATPAYTLPGNMGGPGSAIRISRGPEIIPVTPVPEVAPLPGNSAVRVEDILRERRIAEAEARARAALEPPRQVVVVTQPSVIYRPARPHVGFRLVVDKPGFFLGVGSGPWPEKRGQHPPHHKEPRRVWGATAATSTE
jgi:hypothetical protein